MSRKRCCCGGSCSNTNCSATVSDCQTKGLAAFSLDLTAVARIPACERSTCNIIECDAPEGLIAYEMVGGCLPCNIYTCTPCQYFPTTGSVMNTAEIQKRGADPTVDNATCDYTWSQGYTWTDRQCGPTPEFKCRDNPQVIDAGCAILPYLTITRQQTITMAQFDACTGGPAPGLPTNVDGLYGFPCDGCGTVPTPCCCTDCTGTCHSIKMTNEIVMAGLNTPKQGIIYARVLEMIPCTGPSVGGTFFCGSGCDGTEGYSQITIEFRAIIPTEPMKANELYTQQCIDVTAGSDLGRVRLPEALSMADLGQGDEAGDFWCVGENSVVVTWRKCRSTANSFENKCRMQSGTYDPVFIGIGSCVVGNPCEKSVPNPCDVSGISNFLQALGWSFNLVVS